jgi:hypothetical protein
MQAFSALDISGIENDPFMRKESNLVSGTPFGDADQEILKDLFNQDASCKQFEADKKFDLTGNDDSASAPNFDDIFGNNSRDQQKEDESPRSNHKRVDTDDYQTP